MIKYKNQFPALLILFTSMFLFTSCEKEDMDEDQMNTEMGYHQELYELNLAILPEENPYKINLKTA